MNKRIFKIILLVLLLVACLVGIAVLSQDGPTDPVIVNPEPVNPDPDPVNPDPTETDVIDYEGIYTTMEDVSLYLHTYGELPSNFITKKKAQSLGWTGGGLDKYYENGCIGGDKFGNYEGLLPDGEQYYECDINTLHKKSRGAERLVYTLDGDIYYTGDHYESFEQLYEGE